MSNRRSTSKNFGNLFNKNSFHGENIWIKLRLQARTSKTNEYTLKKVPENNFLFSIEKKQKYYSENLFIRILLRV